MMFDIAENTLEAMTPEAHFVKSSDRATRKQFGQFFTPAPIAKLMADWVMEKCPQSVIDPAVGPGVLLQACAFQNSNARLIGFDIDEFALSLATQRLGNKFIGNRADFLSAEIANDVDAIICNPPYIRHHDYNLSHADRSRIELRAAKKTSRLSNIYIYFILKACSHLALNGRAAFLVPAEWSNANFGDAIKQFFANTGYLKQVVYFSGDSLVFDDNLSTGCLLLIENGVSRNVPVKTFYLPPGTMPKALSELTDCHSTIRNSFSVGTLAATKKWDHLIANGTSAAISGGVRLGELARTKRGIATGDNGFFILNQAEIIRRGIPDTDVKRCISKAAQVKSEILSREDAASLELDAKIFLFDPQLPLCSASEEYVTEGETAGVCDRYLTKSRRVWHTAESRSPAPIWAAVFGREQLRFCYNEAGLYNLTTFHGIYPISQSEVYAQALTACLNSKPIQLGMKQQHRIYGGGLLKVEPRDLLDVIVPNLSQISSVTLTALAKSLILGQNDARNQLVERAFEEAEATPDRLL